MSGRLIITLTGGIRKIFRFFNKVLGFLIIFTGFWVILFTYFNFWLMYNFNSGFAVSVNEFNYDYGVNVGSIIFVISLLISITVLIWNCYRFFKSLPPDNFLLKLFKHNYRPEREGKNIPKFMIGSEQRDINGMFFGTKKLGFWFKGKFFVGKPQNQDGHIIVVGGAGSGKSSCIAKPTIETWNAPIFAIDIKGELSSYWHELQRKNGTTKKRAAKIFDPTKTDTCGYDPYYLLRQDGKERLVQNAREIALSIIPLPNNMRDPFWIQAAQNLLTAAILYFFGIEKNFSETMMELQSVSADKLRDIIGNSNNIDAKVFINQFSDLEPKVMAGIATELSNKIMVFATDPLIKNALRDSEKDESCFSWNDLEKDNIFLCLPEDKIEQWSSLTTLMLNQLIRTLERRPDKTTAEGKNRPPILLLLDEIARVGKVDSLVSGLATLRSKGVTFCLMIQSLAQLDNIHGSEARRIIVDNCPYKAILSATDAESQKYFSDLVGTCEVEKENRSINYDSDDGIETGHSSSWIKHREPIIFPADFAKLKDIVLMTPEGFCRVDKAPYYEKQSSDYEIRSFSEIKKLNKEINAVGLIVLLGISISCLVGLANFFTGRVQAEQKDVIVSANNLYSHITRQPLDEDANNLDGIINAFRNYIFTIESEAYTRGDNSGYRRAALETEDKIIADRAHIYQLVTGQAPSNNYIQTAADTGWLFNIYIVEEIEREVENKISDFLVADRSYILKKVTDYDLIFPFSIDSAIEQHNNYVNELHMESMIFGEQSGWELVRGGQRNYLNERFDFGNFELSGLSDAGLIDLTYYATYREVIAFANERMSDAGFRASISMPEISPRNSTDKENIEILLNQLEN